MSEERIPPFRMTDAEKNSQLWLRLREHLERLNDRDRKRNDDTALTEEETRVLRCTIRARKDLINSDF